MDLIETTIPNLLPTEYVGKKCFTAENGSVMSDLRVKRDEKINSFVLFITQIFFFW